MLFISGIPTSRAVAMAIGSDSIIRDKFYTGNFQTEKSAIVLRAAPSWFRFGSYEIHAKRKDIGVLRELADFTIEHFFPDIDMTSSHRYLEWFSQVVNQTAYMIALWQSVGFTHGVCNTDNFSILSITIDYGPFGFMDSFEKGFVPNTSDDERRAFNLDKLRHVIEELIPLEQHTNLMYISLGYKTLYLQYNAQLFSRKLGLYTSGTDVQHLVELLLDMMHVKRTDFTITFTQLSQWSPADIRDIKHGGLTEIKKLSRHPHFREFCRLYHRLISEEVRSREVLMEMSNPRYVLRNWMAQRAIEDAEAGNYQTLQDIARILSKPFTEQLEAEQAGYGREPPAWAKQLRVSCSS